MCFELVVSNFPKGYYQNHMILKGRSNNIILYTSKLFSTKLENKHLRFIRIRQ